MATPSTSPLPGRTAPDAGPDLRRLLLGLSIVTLGVVLLLGSAGENEK